MAVNLKGRSFLTLADFTPAEIRYLLDLARDLKAKAPQRRVRAHHAGASISCCSLKRPPPAPGAPLRWRPLRRAPT